MDEICIRAFLLSHHGEKRSLRNRFLGSGWNEKGMDSGVYWWSGKWIGGVCEVMNGDVSEMVWKGVWMDGDRSKMWVLEQLVSLYPHITSFQSGSLPLGLELNSRTGEVFVSPSIIVSNQPGSIKAANEFVSGSITLSFSMIHPIVSFSYVKNRYVLRRGKLITLTPSINGDTVMYSITRGWLPWDYHWICIHESYWESLWISFLITEELW